MRYFSYNEYFDIIENGKLEKAKRLEENIEKYETKNGNVKSKNKKNTIIEILENKRQLKLFINDFFHNICIGNFQYCNKLKSISDVDEENNIICKLKEKEIFIFIKIVENIDNNISFKMLEHCTNIIEKWEKDELAENKNYPIVIPIVLYIGNKEWKRNVYVNNDNLNYVTFKENRIDFYYNIIQIKDLKIQELNNMKSDVAKEIIKIRKEKLYK